ncbi:MAG: DUF6885 family protein [Solirubrobacteraceae bacterium]
MAVLSATALLPGAAALLGHHDVELPQKDGLCGPFWGALALRARGIPADQDAVALAAGTTITRCAPRPPGARPRRDYVRALPPAAHPACAGTTAERLAGAIEILSDGALAALPASGGWNADGVRGLLQAPHAGPVTALANLDVGLLWGSHANPASLACYLERGDESAGPPADWRTGHFVALIGLMVGVRGALVVVADSYRSLGCAGVHLQPVERVAQALAREGSEAQGGVLLVVDAAQEASAGREIEAAGLTRKLWDNRSRPAAPV